MEDTAETKRAAFESLRRQFRTWRLAHARKALAAMILEKDTEIYRDIRECAEVMARNMCMRWLDNRRVNHCAVCPNTDQLLSVAGLYHCSAHVSAAGKVDVPLALVRP